MLYETQDLTGLRRQLWRRIALVAALALIPNLAALILMYTARIQWLSIFLGCLGGALAIFTWGMSVSPVIAYHRFVREVLGGRSHEFTGTLRRIAQDSTREGVPCKTLYFYDEQADDEKLCYFDRNKYPREGLTEGGVYTVSVHGQAIVALSAK